MTVNALREENPKKNTQARVAALLGVSDETVSRWFRTDDATNSRAGNSCTRPDARVKVNPKHKPIIAERVARGESQKNTQKRVAALLGVDQTTVSLWFCKDSATNTSARNGCSPVWVCETCGQGYKDFREYQACVRAHRPDARVKVNPKHKPLIAERYEHGQYEAALEATPFEKGTLKNDRSLAKEFESSRRRDDLTWQHHAEVAALPRRS